METDRLVASTTDPAFALDLKGKILGWNESTEELELMRWSVGKRRGVLGRQLQTSADGPCGGNTLRRLPRAALA